MSLGGEKKQVPRRGGDANSPPRGLRSGRPSTGVRLEKTAIKKKGLRRRCFGRNFNAPAPRWRRGEVMKTMGQRIGGEHQSDAPLGAKQIAESQCLTLMGGKGKALWERPKMKGRARGGDTVLPSALGQFTLTPTLRGCLKNPHNRHMEIREGGGKLTSVTSRRVSEPDKTNPGSLLRKWWWSERNPDGVDSVKEKSQRLENF